MQELILRAKALLHDGTVARVLGWKRGEHGYDPEPAFFETPASLDSFQYDDFCGANLSKYMIEAMKKEGRTLVFLKPCDSYSFNQLLNEHRVSREKAYIIGVGCRGKIDPRKLGEDVLSVTLQRLLPGEKLSAQLTDVGNDPTPAPYGAPSPQGEGLVAHGLYGDRELAREDVLLERCYVCKGKTHQIADEVIGESADTRNADRMAEVERLEAMTPEDRFAFWQQELSKCIRCNACRNVCPACSCRKCVFDSTRFDSQQKANSTDFEEKMFHIIRAFHVAGRCTDCGECSRVCPQGIPLHLLNRKFIKDIDAFYGAYQAGEAADARNPLVSFEKTDCEPSIVAERG